MRPRALDRASRLGYGDAVDRLIALVTLRWRLELRAMLRARERAVGLLVAAPFMLLGALAGAGFLYFGTRFLEAAHPELVLPIGSALATGIGLLWALSPVLTGIAFAETHDVSRLMHFPIPLATLVVASLVANLVQPAVLAASLDALVLAAALAERPALLPGAFLACLLALGFMLAAGHVAGLLLHGAARNRRLRDALLFVGLGVSFLMSLLPIFFLMSGAGPLRGLARIVTELDVFALSPFAWGVRAAVHAGRGEGPAFLVQAALSASGTVVLVAAAAHLTSRIHRGELDLGQAAAGPSARARMLFEGQLGAMIEKDLRMAWRDPALKASILLGLVGPLFFLFVITQTGLAGRGGGGVLLLASLVGIQGVGGAAFALERRGLQLLLGLPVPRFKVLVAKNLSLLALRLPGLLSYMTVVLVMAPLALLPAGLTILIATALLAAGADNYLSVLSPVVAPAAGRNPYGGHQAGGRGLGAALMGMLVFMAALLGSAPFAFLAWLPLLLDSAWLWVVTLPLALAGAASIYAMLVAGAARLLERREPELLARVLGEE
jgi:ABC-2 type transport system permease protein